MVRTDTHSNKATGQTMERNDDMNRATFIATARELLDEMERDYECHSGITASEQMPFASDAVASWLDELAALYENART